MKKNVRAAVSPKDVAVVSYLKKFYSENNSYLITNEDFSIFEIPSKGIIGYRIFNDRIYALGGLIGEDPANLLQNFLEHFPDKEIIFVSVSEKFLPFFEEQGFRINGLEMDAVISLNQFHLDGKKKKNLRRKYNMNSKKFNLRELTNLTNEEKKKLNEISDTWLKFQRKANRKEFDFFAEKFSADKLGDRRLFVVEKKDDGEVVAFYVINPSFYRNGYETQTYRFLPEYRRSEINQFAFVKIIEQLRSEGFSELSLAQVFFNDLDSFSKNDNRLIKNILKFIYNYGGWFINHKNLFLFKNQLHPNWERRYLCAKPEFKIKHVIDLLRISNKI